MSRNWRDWPIQAKVQFLDRLKSQPTTSIIGHRTTITEWAAHFYIEDRYDNVDAASLGVGPILLAEHQRRILEAALERDASGRFRWSTIIWSAPKKSGKTRIAAMVAAWLAWQSGQYAEVYCLANDGKQSADRVLGAIKKAVSLSPELRNWKQTLTSITLPSGAFIEAVPVDPTGEAGGQPTGSFWSELWGFKHSAAKKLWTEFTIPPTRFGYALRWVESYAGYTGESPVLENLYASGVLEGVRDKRFPTLPVYLNERAGIFAYWDTEPRMAWQTPEYYAQEAATLTESEFLRVHRNTWVSSESSAIPLDLWDARQEDLPKLSPDEPVVLGLDLGVSGDYCALVAVTKHTKGAAIRAVRVWKPPQGGKIDYSATVEPAIKRWCENLNVVCVAYDEYQAHKMVTDLGRQGIAWFYAFPQGKGTKQKPGRPVADKMFFDMVMSGKLVHNGDATLRDHVNNAAGKSVEERYLRFVKKSTHLKIDALVAASMAVATLMRLNV